MHDDSLEPGLAFPAKPSTEHETEAEAAEELAPKAGEGWAVILFNDDHHAMDYVVLLLCCATGFEVRRAWEIMLTAHTRGRAIVTITERPEAERVAAMLRDGGLMVELKAFG